jgi:hypothetical protein
MVTVSISGFFFSRWKYGSKTDERERGGTVTQYKGARSSRPRPPRQSPQNGRILYRTLPFFNVASQWRTPAPRFHLFQLPINSCCPRLFAYLQLFFVSVLCPYVFKSRSSSHPEGGGVSWKILRVCTVQYKTWWQKLSCEESGIVFVKGTRTVDQPLS